MEPLPALPGGCASRVTSGWEGLIRFEEPLPATLCSSRAAPAVRLTRLVEPLPPGDGEASSTPPACWRGGRERRVRRAKD
jgi:hypothetical protein